MSIGGSVTQWIEQLKAGEPGAAQALWERYFGQLVERARQKLRSTPRRAADEEDVALSAFDSFCRAAGRGCFPRLDDRHDLWQVLLVLTDRKAFDLAAHERRQRRGGGKVVDEAALGPVSLGQFADGEPGPAYVALVADEFRRLLALLGDPELRHVAVRKMEGLSVEEIAAELGLVPRTVQRRLRLIRLTWEREGQP
jgi:DNA-directed RNA polymerase specialized sigma24 family protein